MNSALNRVWFSLMGYWLRAHSGSRNNCYMAEPSRARSGRSVAQRAKKIWLSRAPSIQPKFQEVSVRNSMDRLSPTGKVSIKLVHPLRWSTFPGRTGLNFGWMDRTLCIQEILVLIKFSVRSTYLRPSPHVSRIEILHFKYPRISVVNRITT